MQVIQQIGSYAGLAAVVGLAVLSALYFSQARDLRRLREWAARVPDRPPSPRSAPQPRGPVQGSDRGAQASAAAGGAGGTQAPSTPRSGSEPPAGRGTATAVSEAAPPQARGSATALQIGSPSGQGGRPASAARAASPRAAPTGTQARGASPRAAPGAGSRTEDSWDLRYVALAVVGALIVVGAGTFAVGLIGGGEEPTPQERAGQVGQPTQPAGEAPGAPGSVTFSVLNGTGVDGLAKQVADELEAAGYLRGNVTNASAQKAESAVLYAQGARGDALAVARELDVSQTEPIDAGSQALAGDATVVVVVGADQTQ